MIRIKSRTNPGSRTWEQLFELAVEERSEDANDLVPYWIYEAENGYKIERQVPMLPLSRELGHYERLKKSLVAYRSVIGQARQQELLEFLAQRVPSETIQKIVDECAIDLQPPR
jgi:hypothetical protein